MHDPAKVPKMSTLTVTLVRLACSVVGSLHWPVTWTPAILQINAWEQIKNSTWKTADRVVCQHSAACVSVWLTILFWLQLWSGWVGKSTYFNTLFYTSSRHGWQWEFFFWAVGTWQWELISTSAQATGSVLPADVHRSSLSICVHYFLFAFFFRRCWFLELNLF
jgi:hypothetical protein